MLQLMMTHGKSIDPARNEELRKMVREIVVKDFDNVMSSAAKAFGVTPTSVSDFLAGKRGAGNKLLDGLAKYTGKSFGELAGRPEKQRPTKGENAISKHLDRESLIAEVVERWGDRVDLEIIEDVLRIETGRSPEYVNVEDVKRFHDILSDIYSRNPKAKIAARS